MTPFVQPVTYSVTKPEGAPSAIPPMLSSADEPNWLTQSKVPEGSNFATKISVPPLFTFGADGGGALTAPRVMPAT